MHSVGGLCSYDQANLNGIMGITRPGSGFDICFFNLHKTFSAPHGCGGPEAGRWRYRYVEALPSCSRGRKNLETGLSS